MKIKALECKELKIPFNVSFQHSSARRNKTESILVQCHTYADVTGIGEGCPRNYVTGETIDSALAFFSKNQAQWSEISSLDDLADWISIHRNEIDTNPAAFSAIEISILMRYRSKETLVLNLC